jgi:YidC/Oxa1 family membrane protein insertase
MDKRTILAVVLSSAIVILWQMFVLGPQEKRMREARLAFEDSVRANAPAGAGTVIQQSGEAPPTGEIAAPETPAAAGSVASPGTPSAGTGLAPLPSSAEEEVVVAESDLFRAKFSTRGARVTSYALFGFPSYRGGVVDLIPETGLGAFGLTLHTRDGDLSLDDFVFTAEPAGVALKPGESGALVFSGEPLPGLRVTKRFEVKAGSYDWTLDIGIDRGPGAVPVYAYSLDMGAGVALTEENIEQDKSFVAAAVLDRQGIKRKKLGDMKKQPLTLNGKMDWAALTNKYFVIGLGAKDAPGVELVIRPHQPATGVASTEAIEEAQSLELTMKVPVVESAPNVIRFYAGPQEIAHLEASPLRLGEAISFGWSFIHPISQLLLRMLKLCYQLIPNYGVAIIVISAISKLAFYRLTHQSIKSMKDMKKVQGELEEIRKKYKNDPRRMQEATMALYKKNKINPMAGCLPMLLQMPLLYALNNLLSRTIELRGAPFLLWIRDLSAPDVLFRLPFSLPFIGSHVAALPIILGIATYLQMKATTIDPKQQALLYMMPVFMTVIFFNFPAGLVLYWLVNTVLTIAQQYLIDRKERATAGALAVSEAR